jgi:hypothetical protein
MVSTISVVPDMGSYIDILPSDIIEKIIEDALDEHEKTIEKLEKMNRRSKYKIQGNFDSCDGLNISKITQGYFISFGNVRNKYVNLRISSLLILASFKNREYKSLPSLLSPYYIYYSSKEEGIKKFVDYTSFLRPIKLAFSRNYTNSNSNVYISRTYRSLIGLDILRETAESLAITCCYNKTNIEYLKKISKNTGDHYDIFIENEIEMEDNIDYYLVCLDYNNNIGVD